mmetsp:Transcript_5172/g.7581  ORF Transcript_5172/g.7581 Transcript_5172/m.7581 type:complete len:344 (-) Transcript_5172:472-1503(-)
MSSSTVSTTTPPPNHQTHSTTVNNHLPSSSIQQRVTNKKQEKIYSFLSGLIAGVAQAGLFNPYDRALYLSVKQKRSFAHLENFTSPYQGFLQSIVGRAFSGGLFFPLEHFYKSLLERVCDPQQPHSQVVSSSSTTALTNFCAGTAAGATNALVLNPISAVKYKTWGRDANRGMIHEALGMYRKGGIQPFLNGMLPTLGRDIVFGGCYTFLRMQIRKQLEQQQPENPHPHPHSNSNKQHHQQQQWIANASAAAIATVVSGPLNFARNVQYATKSRKERKSIICILSKLVNHTLEKPTWMEKWTYVQNRLRIGWGTARVAVGVAFGHHVYDVCMTTFHNTTASSY